MPIQLDKTTLHEGWTNKQVEYEFSAAQGVSLVCGALSGNLEAIDIDLKYDLTGPLFERYKKEIFIQDNTLLKKLVVQKTRSGGYHFIYRCAKIEGNKKLARRHATDEEKAKNEKIKVLLETRGEGGYIACWPTKGYQIVHGSYESIETITEEQRDILFSVAGSFNEYFTEYQPRREPAKKTQEGLSPFEDYNNRADVIALLQKHDWTVVNEKGNKVFLRRPGDTKARHSGNFDLDKNWFTVFTTSSVFEPETAYQPYAVYALLETGGDFKEASKQLYDAGYGERKEQKATHKVETKINPTDEDYSFIAKREHYDPYLTSLRNGTFQMGLTTGFKTLDKHFLFKPGNLVVVNGHDNVGKSVVIWYLALLSNLLHGWKWIVFSSENSVGSFMRKMIEYYWCEPLSKLSDHQYRKAYEYIEQHFTIIRADEDLYNYKDILTMAKKILAMEHHQGLLIDPYNSLKIGLAGNSKFSTHDYHYEALSEIKLFNLQNNIASYINCHAVTNALRQKDSDGFPAAPLKADTEGGGKFANKADDFITIHRKLQHPSEWMVSELHIRKIKETETGGRVTTFQDPVRLCMVENFCGFEEINELGISRNPVIEFHNTIRNN